jgi:5-formyltetrahydrofolate cyclo-ligase
VIKDRDDESGAGDPASPPCLLHELDPDGTPRVDPVQARDVARWRKAERERLIAARLALPAAYRAAETLAMTGQLEPLLAGVPDAVVAAYWPIRGEPDLRPWLRALSDRGLRIALPAALALGRPLVFREWRPGARLERGLWSIPWPADGAVVVPGVVIAPLVGFDRECYRLGYGGGFFDRTLVALEPRPLAIGVGYAAAALPTIYPQPHDIPMDVIVTGAAAVAWRAGCAG